MALVTLIIGILGNITSMLLFLTPVPAFWEICKNKSTGSYSSASYICSLANCLLWSFYGLPFVTKNNILVVTINGSGIVLESVYILIFLIFADKKRKGRIFIMVLGVLLFLSVIIAVSMTKVEEGSRALIVGSIAFVLTSAMYASLLSVMQRVIRTNSVESMPFHLSLWIFINSCLWAAYGISQRDKIISIPNGLGVLFGAMQLLLYGYYRKGKSNHTDSFHVEHRTSTAHRMVEIV